MDTLFVALTHFFNVLGFVLQLGITWTVVGVIVGALYVCGVFQFMRDTFYSLRVTYQHGRICWEANEMSLGEAIQLALMLIMFIVCGWAIIAFTYICYSHI